MAKEQIDVKAYLGALLRCKSPEPCEMCVRTAGLILAEVEQLRAALAQIASIAKVEQ